MQKKMSKKTFKQRVMELHKILHNRCHLRNDQKASFVVALIDLVLKTEEKDGKLFDISQLIGDPEVDNRDGDHVYNKLMGLISGYDFTKEAHDMIKDYLHEIFVTNPVINTRIRITNPDHSVVDKTPLRYSLEYIIDYIVPCIRDAVKINEYNKLSDILDFIDYAGVLYNVFLSYGDKDKQSLGIVLTPHHIVRHFPRLARLKYSDVVLDPCAGTGGFLIEAFIQMIKDALANNVDKARRNKIREQIYGNEKQPDMFVLLCLNFLLWNISGKGLTCADCLTEDLKQERGINIVFMNPPYSLANKKDVSTQHLSEICFIRRMMEFLDVSGRGIAIVPTSAVVGKTLYDNKIRSEILDHHTLEGVITMNEKTFYPVKTEPCITVFTAGQKHPDDKVSKFLNFTDDGYYTAKQLGLVCRPDAEQKAEAMYEMWDKEHVGVGDEALINYSMIDKTYKDEQWLFSYYHNSTETACDDLDDVTKEYIASHIVEKIRAK